MTKIRLNGYHGTSEDKGQSILDGHIIDSIGSRHWLGNGHYLFGNDFYAFKWEMHNHRKNGAFKWDEVDNIIVIAHTILVEEERVFDFDNPENKIEFDRVLVKMKSKGIDHSKIKYDGVVLNYMFDLMHYKQLFDIVKSSFVIDVDRYNQVKGELRTTGLLQLQICVKNHDCINRSIKYDFSDKIEIYKELMNHYYNPPLTII